MAAIDEGPTVGPNGPSGLSEDLEQFAESVESFALFLASTFPESGIIIETSNVHEIASEYHEKFIDPHMDLICKSDESIFNQPLYFPQSNLDMSEMWHGTDLTGEEKEAIFMHLQSMCIWCPSPNAEEGDSIQNMAKSFFEDSKNRVLAVVENCPKTEEFRQRVLAIYEECIPEEKRAGMDVKSWVAMFSDGELRDAMMPKLEELSNEAQEFWESEEGKVEKQRIEDCIDVELNEALETVKKTKFWPLIKPRIESVLGDQPITVALLKEKLKKFFPDGFTKKPDFSSIFNQHPLLKKAWKKCPKNENGDPDPEILQENLMKILRKEFPGAFPPEHVPNQTDQTGQEQATSDQSSSKPAAARKKTKARAKGKIGRNLDAAKKKEIRNLLTKQAKQ